MSNFLVLDTPLTDPDVVANAYSSSEKTAYPSSNVYDLERRRKMWRSAGYWNIESGSNVITFQESAGVDLTATIPVLEYTTTDLLMAAIKAALEAAGAATYTVVQDTTTGRIKITSDLGGGATVFRLMWTTTSAFGTILGFDTSANDTGAATYTADLLRIHTSEWLEWDLGIPTNPSALVAMGDRNIPLNISPTAVIKLQANHTRNWSAPALDLTVTYNEFVLASVNVDGLAGSGSSGFRYWRLYLEDKSNPDLYVQLGIAWLGTHVATSRGCPDFPLEFQPKDYSLVQDNDQGQVTAARRPTTDVFPLSWNGLDTESKEALEAVWDAYGVHSCFIVAMDNAQVFSTDKADMIRLVRFDREPPPSLRSAGLWSYGWVLREEL